MRRAHVLVALTLVVALSFALPAVGATSSPLKIAKQALGLSKAANKTAKSARTTAVSARKTALTARTSATSANTKAQSALDALKQPVAAATNAVNAQNAVTAAKATTADTAAKATSAGSADNVVVLPTRKVAITATAATVVAARSAATAVPLLTRGPLTVYGKCFKETTTPRVRADVLVKSSVDRSALASDNAQKVGPAATEFLNADTAEAETVVATEVAGLNNTNLGHPIRGGFHALAPDGSFLDGHVILGVSHGSPAGGSGPFPTGDGCTFSGVVHLG